MIHSSWRHHSIKFSMTHYDMTHISTTKLVIKISMTHHCMNQNYSIHKINRYIMTNNKMTNRYFNIINIKIGNMTYNVGTSPSTSPRSPLVGLSRTPHGVCALRLSVLSSWRVGVVERLAYGSSTFS